MVELEGQKFRCAVGCQCAGTPEGYQMVSTLDDGHYNSQASAEACQIECQNTNGCEYWTWDPSMGLFLIEILKEFYNNSAVI